MADGFASGSELKEAPHVRRPFSVADLCAMFDAGILSRDEKLELIEGEIIQMNPQMLPHLALKSRLAGVLARCLPSSFEVSIEGSVQVDEANLVEPDLIVTLTLPMERRFVRADEVGIAIEVADTSLPYDLGLKAAIYARAGIEELWVVDIKGSQTWVHEYPKPDGYEKVFSVPFEAVLSSRMTETINITIADLIR